jgi:hypothetical protein
MTGLRLHLRTLVLAWLICQAAVLSAFAPAGCCPERSAAANSVEDCHGADGLCPMHQTPYADAWSATEAQIDCPMHAGQAAPVPCVMRGICDGPAAAISMLLPAFALPEQSFTLDNPVSTAEPIATVYGACAVPLQTDTPPPRA